MKPMQARTHQLLKFCLLRAALNVEDEWSGCQQTYKSPNWRPPFEKDRQRKQQTATPAEHRIPLTTSFVVATILRLLASLEAETKYFSEIYPQSAGAHAASIPA